MLLRAKRSNQLLYGLLRFARNDEALKKRNMTYKRTKIVATISDKNCEVNFLRELWKAGMNVVRLNTAHQSLDGAKKVIDNVRAVSDKIALLVDTKGPEMRTTPMTEGDGFPVLTGDTVKVSGNPSKFSSKEMLYVNYAGFVEDTHVGATILIDDGDIALRVKEKEQDYLLCEVRDQGVIKGRKSVNVPNAPIKLPSLSEKDIEFIHWAVDNELDFIAHSFVRNKEDVMAVQKILDERGSHLKIIAKIENQQGVDNIDEILNHAYGIMVARGDLGVEIQAEKIPVIQRSLIAKAQARKKPVIIATQMLHSMIEHARPTRAEVSDVANAIYQRTDAIMLSGETAYGTHALESVQVMGKIAHEIEQHLSPVLDLHLQHVTDAVAYTLARSLVEATTSLPIKALIFDTISGRTGRYLAAYRPSVPVFAKCYRNHVMRELALSYGIIPFDMEMRDNKHDFVKEAVKTLIKDGFFTPDDMIGVIAGSFGARRGASFIEISEAENLLTTPKATLGDV